MNAENLKQLSDTEKNLKINFLLNKQQQLGMQEVMGRKLLKPLI